MMIFDRPTLRLAPTTSMAAAVMRREIHSQLLRFASVGAVAFMVNATVVELVAWSTGPLWAQAIAFPVAATVAWWLNRRFTFGPSARRMHQEWMRYIAANVFGWTANNGIYLLLVLSAPIAYVHPILGVVAGSLVGISFNFVASKWLVFST